MTGPTRFALGRAVVRRSIATQEGNGTDAGFS